MTFLFNFLYLSLWYYVLNRSALMQYHMIIRMNYLEKRIYELELRRDEDEKISEENSQEDIVAEEDTPVEDVSVEDVSVEDVSVEDVSVVDTPIVDTPIVDTPVIAEESSIEDEKSVWVLRETLPSDELYAKEIGEVKSKKGWLW